MSTVNLAEPVAGVAGGHVTALRCRACGHEHALTATHLCELCFGPLEVAYDYDVIAKRVSRERIAAGPVSLWRYRDLLPVPAEGDIVSLGEGLTPLVHARNLGSELGLPNLHLKNDTQNPTNSFKDRVVAVALNWALQHGFRRRQVGTEGRLRMPPLSSCTTLSPPGRFRLTVNSARHDRARVATAYCFSNPCRTSRRARRSRSSTCGRSERFRGRAARSDAEVKSALPSITRASCNVPTDVGT